MSGIEWTDRTWNPVRGCSRVSEGCRNCYAERFAARFNDPAKIVNVPGAELDPPGEDGHFTRPAGPFHGFAENTPSGPRWTGKVALVPEKLDEPLRWKKPARVFVNSMSDLFHEKLTNHEIARVFAVMASAPRHTFQVLSKRPERMLNVAKKYVFTDEIDERIRRTYDGRIAGRAAAIGKALGWPAWTVKKRAGFLGITHPVNRKDWTPEDEAFLLDHLGSRHVHWIAMKLGRSLASVVMKTKHMKISRRFREGYTLRELELCFGVDHRVIQTWEKDGKLAAGRRDEQGERNAWFVTDEQILSFVRDHPMVFRLDKVDQYWFMDLITSGGLIRKAIADEHALAEAV